MNPSLKWLVLDDFTPGIIQRLGQSRSGYGPAPLGAAAASGTYRCYALPGGGLAPLPRRTFSMIPPDSGSDFNGATSVYNTGLRVIPILYAPTTTGALPRFRVRDIGVADPTESIAVYMGHEFISPFTPTQQQIIATKHYRNGGAWVRGGLSTISGAAAYVTNRMSPVYWTTTTLKNVTSTARIVVAGTAKAQDGASGTTLLGFNTGNPDPDTGGGTISFGATTHFGTPIGHQGRVVFLKRSGSATDSGQLVQANDVMQWTQVGLTATDTTSDVRYFPETPYGIGAWASVSASDLFLVKHYGGGVLIQGDLNNPIIRRLPGVVSTGGSECVGTMSPVGFIYGVNRGGVYAWQGGDDSEPLSPTLDNDFWIPSSMSIFVDFRGQFTSLGSWIIAPNNWLFDIPTKSWWRLEDPGSLVLTMFDTDGVNGFIYGAPLSFNPDDTPALYGFNQNQGASSYRWTSQPILTTDSRQASIDEIVLTAQGNGTVTITIDGQAVAFDIASATSPVRIRKTLGRSVDVLALQVDSTETTGGVVGAPIVYEIRLGLKEERGLPTAA